MITVETKLANGHCVRGFFRELPAPQIAEAMVMERYWDGDDQARAPILRSILARTNVSAIAHPTLGHRDVLQVFLRGEADDLVFRLRPRQRCTAPRHARAVLADHRRLRASGLAERAPQRGERPRRAAVLDRALFSGPRIAGSRIAGSHRRTMTRPNSVLQARSLLLCSTAVTDGRRCRGQAARARGRPNAWTLQGHAARLEPGLEARRLATHLDARVL